MSAFIIKLVRWYQRNLSRYTNNCCRFEPSCSQYMIDAILAYGVVRGVIKGCWRIMRCGRWSAGGYDPAVKPESVVHNIG